jgi:hypothetical protein
MLINCNIHKTHPLINETGVSQDERVLSALNAGNLCIDGRTSEDILDFVLHFSKYVNFYDENLNISNWQGFFNQSTPFLIAKISKFNIVELEEAFRKLKQLFESNKNEKTLKKIFEFVFDESILPILTWQNQLSKATDTSPNFGFTRYINALQISKLRDELVKFIHLKNSADTHLSLSKINWQSYDLASWNIDVVELYSVFLPEKEYYTEPDNQTETVEILSKTFNFFIRSIKGIVEKAPQYFEESLLPIQAEYQKNHQPHLGLFFTFLKLFKYVQNDLNKLTQKHLDFFYQQALQLKPKAAVPDKIHLIFEVAKQIENFKINKSTRFKGNKDVKNADILFDLDDEIVIDKAQIISLKTLYLNPVVGGVANDGSNTFLEGLYIAPIANSADGKGKGFPENQSPTWSSLGSKYSKFYKKGKNTPEQNSKARLGWVFASPVLLLNEGTRTINIKIVCKSNTDFNTIEIKKALTEEFEFITSKTIKDAQEGGLPADELKILEDKLALENPYLVENGEIVNKYLEKKRAFKISFSGEKDWIIPNFDKVVISLPNIDNNVNSVTIELKITLENDVKPITFFNKEALKEEFKTQLPLVKIELDSDIQAILKNVAPQILPVCELERKVLTNEYKVDLYHYLRCLTITNVQIDVAVCGVKNLIVQNDENLQDINSPIYPFGVRPKIDSNFYIGSQEIFLKNWQTVGINLDWKDKPKSLQDHYHGYEDFQKNITKENFKEGRFTFVANVLKKEKWDLVTYDSSNLIFSYKKQSVNTYCNEKKEKVYNFSFSKNTKYEKPPIEKLRESFSQLKINTTDGFLRITLQGQDFQHSRYSFVLARQMMALGKFPNVYVGPQYDRIPENSTLTLPEINIDEVFDKFIEAERDLSEIINGKAFFTKENLEHDPTEVEEAKNNFLGTPIIVEENRADDGVYSLLESIENTTLRKIANDLKEVKHKKVVIPNEPYTPIINNLSIDYTAKADKNDIDFIHLYPFEKTFKTEEITTYPTLLPSFFDEGSLFLGFENLNPGTNLDILFQLAEATADSEIDKIIVKWSYLKSNQWIPLRLGFEIISDETHNLTTSGIIKISVPIDVNKADNTIMPSDVHWLKAAVCSNAKAVGEVVGIHTQAAKATFQIVGNDTNRLKKSLEANSVAKLLEANFNVKDVLQPYQSFGGKPDEASGHFYIRSSELLRHKGRAINRFDYERLVLEEFSDLYRVKCITNTLGKPATNQYPCVEGCGDDKNKFTKAYRRDLEIAPGYVLLAIIPDIRKYKTGDMIEPRTPVSILEKIELFLKKKTSPFVRLMAMNPRYEKINFTLNIKLKKGVNEFFYHTQLQKDLRILLAPWSMGAYDTLFFGKSIYKSDVIKFIEKLDYIDFINSINFSHEDHEYAHQYPNLNDNDTIHPLTARSILIAGDINICIDKPTCE